MDFTKILGEELKKQAMGQILDKVGGDNKTANNIISQALPAILGGFEKNTQTDEGISALDLALGKHTGETKIDLEDGKKILGHLFGGDTDSQVASIAKTAGISGEQGNDVMGILSSLVMEKLGDQKASGLDGKAIAKLLSGSSIDTNSMLGMFLDQDGDGDFDKNDAMKFGMGWIKNKFLGKK